MTFFSFWTADWIFSSLKRYSCPLCWMRLMALSCFRRTLSRRTFPALPWRSARAFPDLRLCPVAQGGGQPQTAYHEVAHRGLFGGKEVLPGFVTIDLKFHQPTSLPVFMRHLPVRNFCMRPRFCFCKAASFCFVSSISLSASFSTSDIAFCSSRGGRRSFILASTTVSQKIGFHGRAGLRPHRLQAKRPQALMGPQKGHPGIQEARSACLLGLRFLSLKPMALQPRLSGFLSGSPDCLCQTGFMRHARTEAHFGLPPCT